MHRSRLLGLLALLVLAFGSSCDGTMGDRRGLEADGGGDGGDASPYQPPLEPEPNPKPDPEDAAMGEQPDGARPDDTKPDDAGTDAGPRDAGPPDPTGPKPPGETQPMPMPEPTLPPATVATDTYGITSNGRLLRFERATGKIERSAPIRGLEDGERILGADIRPANGKLVALSDAARLYEIDLSTGAASFATALRADPNDATAPFAALSGKRFGVDWNPVADRLRVVSDAGENLRIDVASGNTTTDGAIGPGARMLTAAAYTQSFGAACRTRLLVIDGAARRLLLQDPPNAGNVTDIGSLGDAPFDDVSAFEIETAADGSDRGFIAVAGANGTRLLDVDLRTGAASGDRALALESGETLIALTASPPAEAPAQTPGELLGLSASERLISFNRAAPGKLCTSSEIRGLGDGDRLLGFDVRPADGKLYALASSGKLYTVAVPFGEVTFVASLFADAADPTEPFRALSGGQFGIGWNPVADRLRVVSDNGQNLRVNGSTGATTTDVMLNGSSVGASALAYTNAFAGTKSTTLFAIDASQAALFRIGGDPATGGSCSPELDPNNPNCGVTRWIGMLGLGAGTGVGGFEIDGKSATAFAALAVGPATVSTLYTIDLVSGEAALPAGVANATIGGGEVVRSLTLAAVPTARGYALTGDGRLLTFSLATPSAPSANTAITGLQAGERVLGIDVRPADGNLYAPGSTGRLYTIDPASGAASLVAPLAAVSGDDQPFSGFGAAAHGVDFNPAADLLRVVDSDAQNFRIVPAARMNLKVGDVLSDAALSPGAPPIVGAAYSDNFAGTPWTTLYVIDSDRDTLFLQGGTQGTPSPNGGVLTALGALGVDALGDVGFDIAGGHNGLAVAALQTAAGQSELYTVSLGAGWVAPFNPSGNVIGGVGVGPVVGLALELK